MTADSLPIIYVFYRSPNVLVSTVASRSINLYPSDDDDEASEVVVVVAAKFQT